MRGKFEANIWYEMMDESLMDCEWRDEGMCDKCELSRKTRKIVKW